MNSVQAGGNKWPLYSWSSVLVDMLQIFMSYAKSTMYVREYSFVKNK